jgi:N-acetylmuramoyl-L-alanine amidase
MSYTVTEKLIKFNRSGKALNPSGFVVHSTDNQGGTALDHFNYFNTGDRKASAHYIVDWNDIIRLVPENEQAWHAGPTANRTFLSVEMCEPQGDDFDKFQEVLKRTIWLVADACVRYGWNTDQGVWSHNGISNLWYETDHTDPYPYLQRFGWTWNKFIEEVDKQIKQLKSPTPSVPASPSTSSPKASGLLPALIVSYGVPEGWILPYLQEELKAPEIPLKLLTKEVAEAAVKIYGIGGTPDKYIVDGQRVTLYKLYTGFDRADTADAVLEAIRTGNL